MARLFSDNGDYSSYGCDIGTRITKAVKKILDEHPEEDVRDLSLIAINAVYDATLEVVMDRR
jgi:hypothetical protein